MTSNLKRKENLSQGDFSKFRQVLNELMKSRKINAATLSKATHLPPPTISRLISGVAEDPKFSTLHLISSYFSVSIDELMGLAPLKNSHTKTCESISLPVISWKEAVTAKNFIETIDNTSWENWVVTEKPFSEFSFGLKTKRQMEPRFPTGSTLIIEPDLEILDGDLVIVHYKDAPEATIREIILDGAKKKFLPLNNDYGLDNLDSEKTIIGVIVKTVFSYKERRN